MRTAMKTVIAALVLACAAGCTPASVRAAPAGPRADVASSPWWAADSVRAWHDHAYGPDAAQTFDVYAPTDAHDAPVILLVHGGGWRIGNKAAAGLIRDKVRHWVARGVIVISVGYPLLPATPPLAQARSVALALAVAQKHARQWGGDPRRFVLMGHSSGAHLVALISARPGMAIAQGAQPWQGTVALDTAAYDVTKIMRRRHLRLYDRAFGDAPAHWKAASPFWQLQTAMAPFLAVCSSRRAHSCDQARAFAQKARHLGTRVTVLPEDLSHRGINVDLGEPSVYTRAVDHFLSSLGPAWSQRLQP